MKRRGKNFRHPLHDFLGFVVGIAALLCWLSVMWLHYQGTIGTAAMVAATIVLLAVPIAVVTAIERSARAARDAAPDPLAPFREHRVVEDLSLHSNGENDVTLRLALARGLGDGQPVRLEFVGIADLRLCQAFDWPVCFSRLRSRELPGGRDGMRHEVWDEHNDTIVFRCRAITIGTLLEHRA